MIFKNKYSKWIPFGINSYGYAHYLVMVRKNLKTGMLQFKSQKVQGGVYYGEFIPDGLIDVKKQWELINNQSSNN